MAKKKTTSTTLKKNLYINIPIEVDGGEDYDSVDLLFAGEDRYGEMYAFLLAHDPTEDSYELLVGNVDELRTSANLGEVDWESRIVFDSREELLKVVEGLVAALK